MKYQAIPNEIAFNLWSHAEYEKHQKGAIVNLDNRFPVVLITERRSGGRKLRESLYLEIEVFCSPHFMDTVHDPMVTARTKPDDHFEGFNPSIEWEKVGEFVIGPRGCELIEKIVSSWENIPGGTAAEILIMDHREDYFMLSWKDTIAGNVNYCSSIKGASALKALRLLNNERAAGK